VVTLTQDQEMFISDYAQKVVKEVSRMNKETAEDDLGDYGPSQPMDYLIRQQENVITQTKYYFYKLYDPSDKAWSQEQKDEWGSAINEQGFRKSEIFDTVPAHHRYVVAIPETGEWKSFKTRSEVTQDRKGGAMYPYAMWSKHEKARMEAYGAMKLMTLACSKVLPENCDNGVTYLKPSDIERVALILLSIDEERREESEFYDELGSEEE